MSDTPAPAETLAATAAAVPPPPPRRRRWLRWALLLVPVALVAASWVYLYVSGDVRLRRAIAEADRLDPHWRLNDVLEERPAIPDEENGALVSIAAKKQIPGRWPFWDYPPAGAEAEAEGSLLFTLQHLKPNEALTPTERAEMRPEIERAARAIQEARKLVDYPRGRFPIAYSKDFISTLLPNVQDARSVANVLSNDALFRAQSGDLDGAILNCRALVNNARSLGDEPTLIPQLIRMAIRAIAVGQTERTLGQGEPSADGLAALQRDFEEEAEEPLVRWAIRGERGGMDQFMQSLQSGSLSVRQMQGLLAGGTASKTSWAGEQMLLYLPGTKVTSRAILLERMNTMVEISKLPPEEQAGPLKELRAKVAKDPLLVREVMPATEKVSEAERRTRGLLRCAAAALAAERYRRDHGRWPEKLDDLKPDYLRGVLLDPYDNQPLRYKNDGDGVVIWCLGMDHKDDGGDRATLNTYKEGTDVGFRLWDVKNRGVPRK
jgi:hypothetical protein